MLLLSLVGCGWELESGQYSCAETGECPEGMYCWSSDQLCRVAPEPPPGSGEDSGADVGPLDDAGADAGPRDTGTLDAGFDGGGVDAAPDVPPCPDDDEDGVCNDIDRCDGDDAFGDDDHDGVCGDIDLCDGDDATGDEDGDGVCTNLDNCDAVWNPDQVDDVPPGGIGDACVIVFVDDDATGAGNGTSWADATTDLAYAVALAQADLAIGGVLKEIWVAEGTYRHTEPRATVLTMVPGLRVYGGFSGTEARRQDRPDVLLESVIDGDASGNDLPLSLDEVNAAKDTPNEVRRADNSPRVVVMASDTILDGVTVTDGYVATSFESGVGIFVPEDASGVALNRLVVRDNIGAVFAVQGAGLAASRGSHVTITNTRFEGNICWNGCGMHTLQATVIVRDVVFEGNGSIGGQGAGINHNGGELTVENARFVRNELRGNGGCAYLALNGASATFTNVLFDGNIGRRGAVQTGGGSSAVFTNVTVANHPDNLSYEGTVAVSSDVTFVNSVFWNNAVGDFPADPAKWPGSVVSSCAATDLSGYAGGNNILLDQSDPSMGAPFAEGASGELYLANSAAGDGFTSACVDSGDAAAADATFSWWTTLSTRSDGVADGVAADNVDMGYHYPASTP